MSYFPCFAQRKFIMRWILVWKGELRNNLFTTAASAVFAAVTFVSFLHTGWVVGSLEILGSPASLVRSIGNGIADFFRLPYEGLTRGPGAFVSGVSRGTTSFVKHISKGRSFTLSLLLLLCCRALLKDVLKVLNNIASSFVWLARLQRNAGRVTKLIYNILCIKQITA